jgi:DNA-binding NarL/FixJ family response regulator
MPLRVVLADDAVLIREALADLLGRAGALAVAVHAQVPVAMLSQMIYAYPTFHRAIEDAITQLSLRIAGSKIMR